MALSAQGPLARAWPGFVPREGQLAMAQAVSETVEAGGVLAVEAGTGVGKTFAYLVPVLLSGQRALVSTATKALQDQLHARDLPRLAQALNLPLRVALLKGRSSYLCLHRLEQARHHPSASQSAQQRAIARVEQWAQTTHSGDLAELPGLDESSALWPLVTSTRENCLGSHCPRYKACHVNLARKEALAADVVVINHHLFFADLAVRESGVAELLPTVRVTVFDEAHQLNEIGVNFLGQELSTVQLLELARDVLANGLQLARGLVDWQGLAQRLETTTRDWRLAAGQHRGAVRLRWAGQGPQGVAPDDWAQALSAVTQALEALAQGLDTVSELAPDFLRLHERCQGLRQRCGLFLQAPDENGVRWAEVSSALRLVQAPLDIAERFAQLTAPPPAVLPTAAQDDGAAPGPGGAPLGARAWIFTSATLGDEPSLRWFTQPCGLTAARTLQVSSPFDYAQQAALYVPAGISAPGERQHALDVAQLVLEAARTLGGRTLVLTTTLQSMRTIGEFLQARLDSGLGLEVLVQGQSPKRRLMERFREGDRDGQPGCVLVASASFWEGFDVPGDALQLVVIDKLPFPPPDDPVQQARAQRLEQQGHSAFAHQALPEAAVALKQGAGRLIRSESDRGILVVCDPRLTGKGYGRRLLAALPPMRLLQDPAEFNASLRALASPEQLPPGL
ncbi:MAG: putative ATP-dependent helicase DinG [Pseudomonadota bacterium]|jgi:ATP-dependent DNA helicase DinG